MCIRDSVVTAVTTVPSKPAYDMDEEEYDRVMKTITNGSLYTIQPLMPMTVSYTHLDVYKRQGTGR